MPPEPPTAFAPFPIAGVDEVGRGPLAGPVVAAAVVLDPRRPVAGLADSKRLDAPERERLAALIRRRALAWCVASASVAEIDELNILHASLLAMRRAVAGLAPAGDGARPADPPEGADAGDRTRATTVATADRTDVAAGTAGTASAPRSACAAASASASEAAPEGHPADPAAGRGGVAPALVLVDGNRCPELPYPACAVVKGDARVQAIAAASIVAKVARDHVMCRWHAHHPEFGFARHKGYATREHREALARVGTTPLHRRSFAPVRAALEDARADAGARTATGPIRAVPTPGTPATHAAAGRGDEVRGGPAAGGRRGGGRRPVPAG